MSRARYPGLHAHKNGHHDLTRQVEQFVQRYNRGELALNVHLLTFLRDWLVNHIQKEDRQYGPWVNQCGR